MKKPLLIIPNLAIHMNRGVNEGFAPNRAVDLCPLISAGELKQGDFDALYEDGKAPLKHKKIMSHFIDDRVDSEILSNQLKVMAGMLQNIVHRSIYGDMML